MASCAFALLLGSSVFVGPPFWFVCNLFQYRFFALFAQRCCCVPSFMVLLSVCLSCAVGCFIFGVCFYVCIGVLLFALLVWGLQRASFRVAV